MKSLLLILLLSAVAAASINVTLSRKQFTDQRHPYLPERFFTVGAGTEFQLSERFDIVFHGEYGWGDGVPVDTMPPEPLAESNGRIWGLGAGVDCRFLQDSFFARTTAGAAYLLRDYVIVDPTQQRRTDEPEWLSTVSLGLGTRFPVSDLPVLSAVEFMLKWETLGMDYSLVSAMIGIEI